MITSPEFSKKQIIILLANQGDKLSFSNDNVIVKDEEGKIKYQSTCYLLFLIIIIGNISITSGLLQRAKKFGFGICLMTQTFRVYQTISNGAEGNTLLRQKQYYYNDVNLGKWIIRNKIMNQREALNNFRNKSEALKEAIALLDHSIGQLSEREEIGKMELLGIEGNAARIYFSHMFDNSQWKRRQPRIKADFTNATLDFGYTLLFNFVDALLSAYGFDTYYGVLHTCFYMRKSLVCDLMEPMRPLIDLQVRKAINLGQCKEIDFQIINKRFLLPWKENPKYLSFLMKPIIDNKDEIFLFIQQYYRSFMKEREAEDFPVFTL